MFKYALLTLVLFTTTANAEKEFATWTQQREWLAAAYALRCYRATESFVSNPAFSKEEIASVCTCSAAKLVDSYSENDLKDFADNGTWKQFPPELGLSKENVEQIKAPLIDSIVEFGPETKAEPQRLVPLSRLCQKCD